MFLSLSRIMKTTAAVITLLGGCAVAETGADFNNRLSRELAQANYIPTSTWKLSCTFAATPANKELIQLDDMYYLVNQARYWWGLNMEPTNILTNNKVCTLRTEGNVYTYTARTGELPVTWTMNEQGTAPAPRPCGKDLNVTIECDGENSRITMTYGLSPQTDIFVLPGIALNATRIRFNEQAAVYNYNLAVEKNNPYPARIAVSLGALAILALIVIGVGGVRRKTANS